MRVNTRTTLLIGILCLLLFAGGCGMDSAHASAITGTIESYTEYYIEVRNLTDQVREQAESFEENQPLYEYTILVEIPDYTAYDLTNVPFELPSFDLSAGDADAYRAEAYENLLHALELYAHENEAPVYYQLGSVFSVIPDGGSWRAEFSSRSRREIQKTVEDLIMQTLSQNEVYRSNLALLTISSAMKSVLRNTFGGREYADLIEVTDISIDESNNYTVSIGFPGPSFVFNALGELYAASFNKPIYGEAVSAELSIADIGLVDLSDAPQFFASVSFSYDPVSESVELLDDFGLGIALQAVKARTETSFSNIINTAWLVSPETLPGSGKVLEGESKGNEIVFVTDSDDDGKYYYVRFYLLPDKDPEEEGTLQAGVFIYGGKKAKLRLPTGYYRVDCWIGGSWYGLEHLFGDDYTYFGSSNAIRSRSGYSNTISFD